MTTKGEKLRTRVRRIISKDTLSSTATLNKYTYTLGTKGGYEDTTEILATTTSIDCIPSTISKPAILQELMGDIKQGDVSLLIRDDVSIDIQSLTDYEVIFNNDTYKLDEIKPIFFNDVTIAKTLILTKELD